MVEAVNGMVDNLRSGRRSIQQDNDQTLLQQIGPILGDSLVMKKVPSLQVACYMVITVLASKADLDDVALAAFMDQLVIGWTNETVRPGIVCLSILAQYRSAKQLPGKVTKALLKIQDLQLLLLDMWKEHRVDRLANGLALALIDRLTKKGDTRGLPIIKTILSEEMLPEKQTTVIFKMLIVAAHKIDDEADQDGKARKQLGLALVQLSQSAGQGGELFRKVIEDVDFDIEELELKLGASIQPRKALEEAPKDVAMENGVESTEQIEDLESALARLTTKESALPTCLSTTADAVFDEISQLFLSIASADSDIQTFDAAPLLHRVTAPSACFYFTFYMRLWLGPYPTLVRVRALELAKSRAKEQDCAKIDLQGLLPYAIAALSDPAKKVRRAAADLITVLGEQQSDARSKKSIWGSKNLYADSKRMHWLSAEANQVFLQTILLPALEESILHEEHISAVLKSSLDSSKRTATSEAESSKKSRTPHAIRLSILSFLASHVVKTPLVVLKVRLLKALNQIRGVSSTTRTDLLLPALQWWSELSAEEVKEVVIRETVDESLLDLSFVDVVVANDKAGLDCFFEIVSGPAGNNRAQLVRAIFSRIRRIWSSMKDDAKLFTAQKMLDLAQRPTSSDEDIASEEAADLLRNVDLTTDILLFLLESLQDTARMATEPPANKRRRTSSSDHHRGLDNPNSQELSQALRKVTFVLQIVEASNPAEHPKLLQGLFMTLSDLQLLRTLVGSELGYLQNLVLSSLLAMMPAYRDNRELKIDTSVGHGDVLVNCIQKSSSPAVQNSALLLVASLAQTAPDVVLHSVMPIFTFMGSSVLRQGDEYSAHVINQTIKEVVPPLIDTFRKGRRNIVASASELLSSFVVAYEHIPSHRKHELFISLTENLGSEDFLFALVAMFVDKYGTSDDILSFSSELMGSFSVETQLLSLVKFLELVADMFKPKPGLSASLFFERNDAEDAVNKTALKELTLLPYILGNRTLKKEIGLLAERDDMEAAKIRELYAQLLEDLLNLADVVRSKAALHSKCGDALSSLLNLLSIGEFIKAVETLLDRPKIGLRHKVLRALEVRIENESTADPKSRTALLAFLPQLTAVIRDSDDIHYKHTAVGCVDKISEKYGKKDLEAVAAAASTIAGDQCLGQGDQRLRVMALLCLSSLVDVLQDGIVPVLPTAIPKALTYLQESIAGVDSNVETHNACYSFMTALAQYLPYMISGSYLDQLLASSNISAEAGLDDECNDNRRQCLRFLAKQLDAKVIFSALQQNWTKAVDAGYSVCSFYNFIWFLMLIICKGC